MEFSHEYIHAEDREPVPPDTGRKLVILAIIMLVGCNAPAIVQFFGF